jgi:hypothetical protein
MLAQFLPQQQFPQQQFPQQQFPQQQFPQQQATAAGSYPPGTVVARSAKTGRFRVAIPTALMSQYVAPSATIATSTTTPPGFDPQRFPAQQNMQFPQSGFPQQQFPQPGFPQQQFPQQPFPQQPFPQQPQFQPGFFPDEEEFFGLGQTPGVTADSTEVPTNVSTPPVTTTGTVAPTITEADFEKKTGQVPFFKKPLFWVVVAGVAIVGGGIWFMRRKTVAAGLGGACPEGQLWIESRETCVNAKKYWDDPEGTLRKLGPRRRR